MEGGQFRKFDVLWELPVVSIQQASFGYWCQAFVRANLTHRQTLHRDLRLPLEAYLALLRSQQPDQWTGSTSVDACRLAARDLFTSGKMVQLIADELGLQTSAANMDIADEQRKLEKYFPGVAKDAVFCLGCASYGHRFAACPLRSCRLCGSNTGGHTLFGCEAIPTVSETSEEPKGKSKARAKGKGKAAVTSQATPASSASPSKCRYCLEDCIHGDICPMLWRTFVHNPASKRSADEISTACYVCGLDDHFGGDCKDNTGEHISGRQYSLDDDIWSRRYTLQFSDLSKTRRFTGSSIMVNDGNLPAAASAAAQPKREAKRAKIGQSDENTAPQVPKADANANGGGGNRGKGKAKGSNKQAPGPANPLAVQNKPRQADAGANPNSKKRKAKGQQPDSLNVVLPNRSAAPKPATGPAAVAAPTPVVPATAKAKPAPQKAAIPATAPAVVLAMGPVTAPATSIVQRQPKKGKGKQAQDQNNQPGKKKGGKAGKGQAEEEPRTRRSRKRKAAQKATGARGNAQGSCQGNDQSKNRKPRKSKGNNGAGQAQAQSQAQA
ncbi:hypothetical protein SEUCBS139899_000874 [Sporothrix eucalyptigena]|uniref:CCHC-type domain-containing protein n=1 Tax=Sporothrix eucalyptigena TaxID=1812306 RepID=A0ABP0C012_9PEZI